MDLSTKIKRVFVLMLKIDRSIICWAFLTSRESMRKQGRGQRSKGFDHIHTTMRRFLTRSLRQDVSMLTREQRTRFMVKRNGIQAMNFRTLSSVCVVHRLSISLQNHIQASG